jgi:hypothetical protein
MMASASTLKGKHCRHSQCAGAAKGGTAVCGDELRHIFKAAKIAVIVRESGRSSIQ